MQGEPTVKISAINLYAVRLPVADTVSYRLSMSELNAMDSTVIEIVTDAGIKGYGETCPVGPVYAPQSAAGARTALEECCPALIGMNPLECETIYRAMDAQINGLRYAKAAVDIALWDIAGKVYQQPVHVLLGGATRHKVPSYYSTIIKSPEETAALFAEKQAEGYLRIQTKMGGRDFEEDLVALRKIGEVIRPGTKWAVDANRSWTVAQAITASRLNEDLNFVLEQPCNSYEELTAVKRVVKHPLYLDESTENLGVLIKAAVEGVADGFALKVTRLGGLSTMRTVRDICQFRRLPFSCDDSWGGDIIAAACVHLAATIPPFLCEGAWIADPHIDKHYDEQHGIRIINGWIDVPQTPGLGITPDISAWGSPILTLG